jgi:hypothetical protein
MRQSNLMGNIAKTLSLQAARKATKQSPSKLEIASFHSAFEPQDSQ